MAAPFGNQYALGAGGGRPRKFDTPEQLIERIDQYFLYVKGDYEDIEKTKKDKETGEEVKYTQRVYSRDPEPITITGLTLFLGFQSRSSLDDYCKDSEDFSYIIKKAKLLVEHNYEKGLHGESPTGQIFALKNMGWRDKVETEHSGNMGFTWNETKTYETKPEADPGT